MSIIGRTSVVINEEIINKRVKVGIAFMPAMGQDMTTKYFEGTVRTIGTLGSEEFIVFDNNSMINTKYIQTVEIIG